MLTRQVLLVVLMLESMCVHMCAAVYLCVLKMECLDCCPKHKVINLVCVSRYLECAYNSVCDSVFVYMRGCVCIPVCAHVLQ